VFESSIFNNIVSAVSSATGLSSSNPGFSGQDFFCFSSKSEISQFPDIKVNILDSSYSTFTLTIGSEHYMQYFGSASSSGKECFLFRIENGNTLNILGTPTLNAYYVVFSKADSQVGFAPIAGCGTGALAGANTVALPNDSTDSHPRKPIVPFVIAGALVLAATVAIAVAVGIYRHRRAAPSQQFVGMSEHL